MVVNLKSSLTSGQARPRARDQVWGVSRSPPAVPIVCESVVVVFEFDRNDCGLSLGAWSASATEKSA
jgi:hypothetical protein